MRYVLLMVAVAAAAPALADQGGWDRLTCTVSVRAFDEQGQTRPARRVSATAAPAVVFRGQVSPADDAAPGLVFDVFSPRGRRYQTLVATPRVVERERDGRRVKRVTRSREAALAVAGSSIAWTSMYGTWRVEPRIEGSDKPCGKAEYFTIRP